MIWEIVGGLARISHHPIEKDCPLWYKLFTKNTLY